MIHERLPMFPLQQPLLPLMATSLNIFEARYVALLSAALNATGTFGVVLIERGSEVGGGDARYPIGCLATIVGCGDPAQLPIRVDIIGTRRLKVLEWLPDDPHPQAVVEEFNDVDEGAVNTARVTSLYTDLVGVARQKNLEMEVFDWSPNPADTVDPLPQAGQGPVPAAQILWQIALASPFGAQDRYQILAAPGLVTRIKRTETALEDQMILLGS